MKHIAFGLALLFAHRVANAQESFSGEFQLKAKAHIEFPGMRLAADYRIVIEGGTATIKYTLEGKPSEEKGTVILTIQSGIDPTTKRPAKFGGLLRVEVINPGWTKDKFITRIDLPVEATGAMRDTPGGPQPVLAFGSVALADILWLDVLPNGITRYIDPMGVRMHADYSVEVIKNPIK